MPMKGQFDVVTSIPANLQGRPGLLPSPLATTAALRFSVQVLVRVSLTGERLSPYDARAGRILIAVDCFQLLPAHYQILPSTTSSLPSSPGSSAVRAGASGR
jgi:hypothetical protein